MRKYRSENLRPTLRPFIEARNKAIEGGFTDNGGAIHSVKRILDILSLHICYPHLTHINNLKSDPGAELSQNAYALKVIELVQNGATDEELVEFISTNCRLVLQTREETSAINKQNRSRMAIDRIKDAGIALYKPSE